MERVALLSPTLDVPGSNLDRLSWLNLHGLPIPFKLMVPFPSVPISYVRTIVWFYSMWSELLKEPLSKPQITQICTPLFWVYRQWHAAQVLWAHPTLRIAYDVRWAAGTACKTCKKEYLPLPRVDLWPPRITDGALRTNYHSYKNPLLSGSFPKYLYTCSRNGFLSMRKHEHVM